MTFSNNLPIADNAVASSSRTKPAVTRALGEMQHGPNLQKTTLDAEDTTDTVAETETDDPEDAIPERGFGPPPPGQAKFKQKQEIDLLFEATELSDLSDDDSDDTDKEDDSHEVAKDALEGNDSSPGRGLGLNYSSYSGASVSSQSTFISGPSVTDPTSEASAIGIHSTTESFIVSSPKPTQNDTDTDMIVAASPYLDSSPLLQSTCSGDSAFYQSANVSLNLWAGALAEVDMNVDHVRSSHIDSTSSIGHTYSNSRHWNVSGLNLNLAALSSMNIVSNTVSPQFSSTPHMSFADPVSQSSASLTSGDRFAWSFSSNMASSAQYFSDVGMDLAADFDSAAVPAAVPVDMQLPVAAHHSSSFIPTKPPVQAEDINMDNDSAITVQASVVTPVIIQPFFMYPCQQLSNCSSNAAGTLQTHFPTCSDVLFGPFSSLAVPVHRSPLKRFRRRDATRPYHPYSTGLSPHMVERAHRREPPIPRSSRTPISVRIIWPKKANPRSSPLRCRQRGWALMEHGVPRMWFMANFCRPSVAMFVQPPVSQPSVTDASALRETKYMRSVSTSCTVPCHSWQDAFSQLLVEYYSTDPFGVLCPPVPPATTRCAFNVCGEEQSRASDRACKRIGKMPGLTWRESERAREFEIEMEIARKQLLEARLTKQRLSAPVSDHQQLSLDIGTEPRAVLPISHQYRNAALTSVASACSGWMSIACSALKTVVRTASSCLRRIERST